jgi:hypothetical protein
MLFESDAVIEEGLLWRIKYFCIVDDNKTNNRSE